MRDGSLEIIDATDVEAPMPFATQSVVRGDKLHIANGKLGIVSPQGMYYSVLVDHLPASGGSLGGPGDNRAIDFSGTRNNAVYMFEGLAYFSVSRSTWIALNGTDQVYDMASVGIQQFAVGDHLMYLAGGYWPTVKLNWVHSQTLQSDGTRLWTDQLGQVNADLDHLAVRRFEIPMDGTMAVSGNRALVQDGERVDLYDLSTMTPAVVSGGPGPVILFQAARQGHDLWLGAYKQGIYRLNDEDGSFRESAPWNLGRWVYDVTVRDTTLYVQLVDQLVAYDVADPDHPVELGRLEVFATNDFDEFFVGDKLLVNDPTVGLMLIDVQDPTDMKVHRSSSGDYGNGVQYGTLLYASAYDSLCAFHADDLSYVRCFGGFGGNLGQLLINGQTLYAKEDNTINIYGLTDPEHPTYLGTLVTDNWGPSLHTDGTYLYNSGDTFYGSPLEVYSLANPAQPELVTTLPTGYVLSAEPDRLLVNPSIGNAYSLVRYDRTCTGSPAFLASLPEWPNSDVKTLIQATANLCGP